MESLAAPDPSETSEFSATTPSVTLAGFAASVRAEQPAHLTYVQGTAEALLAIALRKHHASVIAVSSSEAKAHALLADLRALAPELRVYELRAREASPYESVRPDRSVTMARASVLARWDRGEVDVLVMSLRAFLQKTAPLGHLVQYCRELKAGERVAPSELARYFVDAGYLRSALVEDPGTFSVRGELIDIWVPGLGAPVRIELEFDQIAKLSEFDSDSQRLTTRPGLASLLVVPAREVILSEDALKRARLVMQSLCDAVNYPSKKARQLVDDVASGRQFFGGDVHLPAYHDLVPFAARLHEKNALVLFEPSLLAEELRAESEHLLASYQSHASEPRFPPEAHVTSEAEIDSLLSPETHVPVVVAHAMRVLGKTGSGLSGLSVAPDDAPSLASHDNAELARKLELARKSAGKLAGLDPLVGELKRLAAEHLSIRLSARHLPQAERLLALLEHRGLEATLVPKLPRELHPGSLCIFPSSLAQGGVVPSEGVVYITEEEIFGKRRHSRAESSNRALKNAVDDLRTLSLGDLVVHEMHGVGRYQGLLHKEVEGTFVDLIVVEYQGGDKLFLPVYRLNQLQKLPPGQSEASVDKLGGQTFEKTKAKAKRKVRELAFQLLKLYAERRALTRSPLPAPGDEYAAFEAAFPYEETPDQAAAIADVIGDLEKDCVMDRLVCGDVGFGKTEVALRAAFLSAEAGRQVAVLCPTTVLAEQHFRTFSARLEDSGFTVRALSRFQTKKEVANTLLGLKKGNVDVVIGTHRMLSKDVHFKNLGLLVVDEEQRFGVTHKERIKELKRQVDVLTLSATPIPRTLSLAVGGLRDMSVMNTPPENRRAIRTFTARIDDEIIRSAITRELARGGQIFYVRNRVEGIYEAAERLKRLIPKLRVGVGHGQMPESELEKTMFGFVEGDFDVLVATAIVESGLDIPRANTILIERADLFGLSQLYQIRGRVGRSSERAFCYLLLPADGEISEEAKARVVALERYTELGSGFHIATLDMEQRGTGELLGADQSGFVASLGFDLFTQMLEEAQAELRGEPYLREVDPELSVDVEALLPETYVTDIGVRLSLYKRFAGASDEGEVDSLAAELAERFGEPPEPALHFIEMMRQKTELRKLKALGVSATKRTVTLHLSPETPLSTESLVRLVSTSEGRLSFSPDGRLSRKSVGETVPENGLVHASRLLSELLRLLD